MNVGFVFVPNPFGLGITAVMLPLGLFWMGAARRFAVGGAPTLAGRCFAIFTVFIALVLLRYQLDLPASVLLASDGLHSRKTSLWLPALVAFSGVLYLTWPWRQGFLGLRGKRAQ
jgi:hypothetical protein